MGKRIGARKREEILRRFEESGSSMAEFCRRRGLCYGTVMRWRREAGALKDDRDQPIPAFVEVELDESRSRGEGFPESDSPPMLCAELVLPGGAMLRIYGNGAESGKNGKNGSRT